MISNFNQRAVGKTSELIKIAANNYGIVLSLIIITGLFELMTDGRLLSAANLSILVQQYSYLAILTMGLLWVIVSGNIDLSSGAIVGVTGALAAVFIVTLQMDWLLASLLCIMAGTLLGAVEGCMIAFFKIPAFIVTLAGMTIFRGLAAMLLEGRKAGPFPSEFQALGSGYLPDVFAHPDLHLTSLLIGIIFAAVLLGFRLWLRHRHYALPGQEFKREPLYFFLIKTLGFCAAIILFSYQQAMGQGYSAGLAFAATLVVIYSIVTNHTAFGRWIYAIGHSETTARLSGIQTDWVGFAIYVNLGALAGLVGVILTARLNVATATAGTGFELDAATACFIGGATAKNGLGTVMAALTGACILAVVNNGMVLMGIDYYLQQIIKGLILIAAVLLDVIKKNTLS